MRLSNVVASMPIVSQTNRNQKYMSSFMCVQIHILVFLQLQVPCFFNGL